MPGAFCLICLTETCDLFGWIEFLIDLLGSEACEYARYGEADDCQDDDGLGDFAITGELLAGAEIDQSESKSGDAENR